jgi:hypothetical protein
VARFCRLSAEFYKALQKPDLYEFVNFNKLECVGFTASGPTLEDWKAFVLAVFTRFGIAIPDKFKPSYVGKSSLTKAEWALLEVTDGMSRGSDLRDSTGMPGTEGDAIIAYVKRLRLEHADEWRKIWELTNKKKWKD